MYSTVYASFVMAVLLVTAVSLSERDLSHIHKS